MAGVVGGFNERDARRIAEVVRRAERAYRNAAPGGRGTRPIYTGDIPVLLTAGIGAGSYTSPSNASATLLEPVNSTGAGLQSAGSTVTVYNPYTKAVTGTNKFAWATPYNGLLYLKTADC